MSTKSPGSKRDCLTPLKYTPGRYSSHLWRWEQSFQFPIEATITAKINHPFTQQILHQTHCNCHAHEMSRWQFWHHDVWIPTHTECTLAHIMQEHTDRTSAPERRLWKHQRYIPLSEHAAGLHISKQIESHHFMQLLLYSPSTAGLHV